MKKLIITLAFAAAAVAASAQDNFQKGFTFGFGAGADVTPSADAQFASTIAGPAVDIWAGYEFCAPLGIRAMASWAGSRTAYDTASWGFRHAGIAADLVLDVANCFGFKEGRAVNPYLFGGFGMDWRFNNGITAEEALVYNSAHNCNDNCRWWDGTALSYFARVGAGAAIRLSDKVMFTLELSDNFMSDRFNSLYDNNLKVDQNIVLSAGLKFTFDQARKYKAARLAAGASLAGDAAAAQAALDAARAAQEAAEKAAAEAEAARKAAREAAEARAKVNDGIAIVASNPLFKIGSAELSAQAVADLKVLANVLKQYPSVRISVTGHADRQTGTPEINWELSKKRAQAVFNKLNEYGVATAQMVCDWKGDKEDVSDTQQGNRTVIIKVLD